MFFTLSQICRKSLTPLKNVTIDYENRVVEGVAIKENRNIAVESNREVQQYCSDETISIDLDRKTLLPVFIDAHLHFTIYGKQLYSTSYKKKPLHLEEVFKIKERLWIPTILV